MIILHSGSGTPIDLNATTITNLRNPEPTNNAFSKGVRCQVNMVDGKYVTVKETCDEVRKLMETTK
jgi:uncharacterized protein YlzI (FlbEa/FlbD family)